MEEQSTSATASGQRNPLWKLAVYFGVLFVSGLVIPRLLALVVGNTPLGGFAKFNQIIVESLDITANRDDALVTVWSLLFSCVMVLPICWVYTYTKSKEGYDRSLVQTLIVMGMVVCGMMMLIQDQFSRALALVGVVSAVRFRTNLRDPKDAVYLLISIGIGMGAGLHVYRVSGWLTLVMCVVFLVLNKWHLGERSEVETPVDTGKKEKKGKKKKDKGGADEGDSAFPVVDRLERIADSLPDKVHGVKRPNTAIILHATDAEAAMGYVSHVLARHGAPWHLVTFAPAQGASTLEYLVFVEGGGDAIATVARDIEDSCGTTVLRDIEVRLVPGGKNDEEPKEAPNSATVVGAPA
jgi:hypothetical protein